MNSPYHDLGSDVFGLIVTDERLRPHWHHEAACAGHPEPEIFYRHPTADHNDAKQVCHTCPVSDLCLDHALDRRESQGVWGGATPAERQTMSFRSTAAPSRNTA